MSREKRNIPEFTIAARIITPLASREARDLEQVRQVASWQVPEQEILHRGATVV
jgi:hypothetical protein